MRKRHFQCVVNVLPPFTDDAIAAGFFPQCCAEAI
jgi:hypothetical protein